MALFTVDVTNVVDTFCMKSEPQYVSNLMNLRRGIVSVGMYAIMVEMKTGEFAIHYVPFAIKTFQEVSSRKLHKVNKTRKVQKLGARIFNKNVRAEKVAETVKANGYDLIGIFRRKSYERSTKIAFLKILFWTKLQSWRIASLRYRDTQVSEFA